MASASFHPVKPGLAGGVTFEAVGPAIVDSLKMVGPSG